MHSAARHYGENCKLNCIRQMATPIMGMTGLHSKVQHKRRITVGKNIGFLEFRHTEKKSNAIHCQVR